MFQTNAVDENQNKYLMIKKTFFFKSCRLWDKVEKYCRVGQATDDNKIQRMGIACWIPKATKTLRICNIYCFSTAKIVTRKRVSVTLYAHCLSCL